MFLDSECSNGQKVGLITKKVLSNFFKTFYQQNQFNFEHQIFSRKNTAKELSNKRLIILLQSTIEILWSM